MHTSILILVYMHNDLHVSANHVTIFREVIYKGQTHLIRVYETTEVSVPIHGCKMTSTGTHTLKIHKYIFLLIRMC